MENETPQELRERMEACGYGLTQQEFDAVLDHTRRKLEAIKKGEDYLPLLLEDEIKDYYFRCTVNEATFLMMAVENIKNSKEV